MKEKNDYGMYSGAFIFDVLDRHALKYIKAQAGLSKKAVLVTKSSVISFQRQLCQKNIVWFVAGIAKPNYIPRYIFAPLICMTPTIILLLVRILHLHWQPIIVR